MNRREFLPLVATKAPDHLRPLVTEEQLQRFQEWGLLDKILYPYDVPKAISYLRLVHESSRRRPEPDWPTSMPEIHHVVDCSRTGDPVSVAGTVMATREWLPPGAIYVNFTEQDYHVLLASDRLAWANLAHLLASTAVEAGVFRSEKTVRKRSEEIMFMAPEFGSGAVRMEISGFPRNSLLHSWYVLPDGSLVPGVERDQPVDYRYVHRLVAKVPDGQITAIELLFGIGFGGLTQDETRMHQELIEHTLAHPRDLGQGKAIVAQYSSFVTTWPEAIRLHDSVIDAEPSPYVIVRRFASWIEYAHYCLAREIAGELSGQSKIRLCEYCRSTLGFSRHRDRRFCLKTENPACARARDADSKRIRRASSN